MGKKILDIAQPDADSSNTSDEHVTHETGTLIGGNVVVEQRGNTRTSRGRCCNCTKKCWCWVIIIILVLSLVSAASQYFIIKGKGINSVQPNQTDSTFNDRDKDVRVILPSLSSSSTEGSPISQEDTLQNTNKIGLGYNLLYGSPVCYTGTCQMEAFAQPVFKLSYTRKAQGSCTSKFIPDNVHIDCQSSVELQAGTEVINTLEQLQRSIMSGIDISADAKIKDVSFSYQHSSQTRYMIDNTIKSNTEVLYTSAKVSTIKLSMYEPFMILSDQFRHAILNIPCCNHSTAEVEKYIYEFIFNYYGFTFVTQLMLGGIAQQNLFINKDELINIESRGYQKSHEAKVAFYASLGMKYSESFNQTKHNEFMRHVTKSYATTLGGDASIHADFEEWSKTVSSNPVVTKLGVKYIFDLLNERRFPDDPNIAKKKQLIENALDKYIQNPVFCYSNCSGRGLCEPSGYFQFGTCKCNAGWRGVDCSIALPKHNTLSGTLCGLHNAVKCGDYTVSRSCPDKWQQTPVMGDIIMRRHWTKKISGVFSDSSDSGWDYFRATIDGFCYKSYTYTESSSIGTLCGISYGNLTVKCDGRNPYSDACPDGYERGELTTGAFKERNLRLCYKVNVTTNDASGTLCGLKNTLVTHNGWELHSTTYKDFEIACSGYFPGRLACPPSYSRRSGGVSVWRYSHILSVCSKN